MEGLVKNCRGTNRVPSSWNAGGHVGMYLSGVLLSNGKEPATYRNKENQWQEVNGSSGGQPRNAINALDPNDGWELLSQ